MRLKFNKLLKGSVKHMHIDEYNTACNFCKVCSLVNSSLNMKLVLHSIVKSVVKSLGFKGSIIRLIDSKGKIVNRHEGFMDKAAVVAVLNRMGVKK